MKRVLIAEDDPFLIKVYSAKLAKLPIEFKLAKNGEEVFEILGSFTPDLMLLDLIMPKKDGFAVLADLKANPSTATIPVIVTTNLEQAEDKDKVMKLGAIEYIVKSNTQIAQIIKRVEEFLQLDS